MGSWWPSGQVFRLKRSWNTGNAKPGSDFFAWGDGTLAHVYSRVPCHPHSSGTWVKVEADQTTQLQWHTGSDYLIKYIVCINMRVFFVASAVLVEILNAHWAPLAISPLQSNKPQKYWVIEWRFRRRGQRAQHSLKYTKNEQIGACPWLKPYVCSAVIAIIVQVPQRLSADFHNWDKIWCSEFWKNIQNSGEKK